MSSKINTLSPTSGIKDPQVRAFCDSLSNAWQLRNGNIGADDKERFITKQEWDYIAKNPTIRALAGIGQPGASTNEPGITDSGPVSVPPGVQNLVDFLNSGITLIDFNTVYKTNNELFAAMYSLTSDIRIGISDASAAILKLQDDVTQINTITKDSDSASAQSLWALKETVYDPATGLEQAHAYIAEINNVDVNSTSANAKQTAALNATVGQNSADIIQINTVTADSHSANARELHGLHAQADKSTADIGWLNTVDADSQSANARSVATLNATVYTDAVGGLPWAIGSINEINNVTATSSSASAKQLSGTMAQVGLKARVFVQGLPAPTSDTSYTLKPGDLWINTANNNVMYTWNSAAWVDASDLRLAESMSGVTNEQLARASSDEALATATNTVWAVIGNGNGLVQHGDKVIMNPGAGEAHNFIQVQTALKDPDTGQIVSAAAREAFDSYTRLNDQRASAAYSLKVQAQAGIPPIEAVAGMALTADVLNGQATTACVFLANSFAIYNQDIGAAAPPFLVSNGYVRINVAHIANYIQSDVFVPADSNNANGTGWRIDQFGNAQFYGTTTQGRVMSGSTLVDRSSGQVLATTAVGSWQSHSEEGNTQAFASSLRFWGPAYHAQDLNGAYPDPYHRIRSNDGGGIQLLATVTFMGVVDHFITVWRSRHNNAWEPLFTTETPSSDYGAATCGWTGTIDCSYADWWLFGVSATNGYGPPLDNTKTKLKDFNMVVTISNM